MMGECVAHRESLLKEIGKLNVHAQLITSLNGSLTEPLPQKGYSSTGAWTGTNVSRSVKNSWPNVAALTPTLGQAEGYQVLKNLVRKPPSPSSGGSCSNPPSTVTTRHAWLKHHIKFMDDLLRPTELKSWPETNSEHCDTLSQYYSACDKFLGSLGNLIKQEDPPLHKIIQQHHNEISLLSINVDPSLEQPDGRTKGFRPRSPYKDSWKTPLVDHSYGPRKIAIELATRRLRNQGQ